jgi:hypothetical protein
MPVDRRRVSALLTELIESHPEPRITLWQLRDALGRRAFGALLFVSALINLLPLPPGAGIVLSLPVVLIAGQLAWGTPYPYFPSWLGQRSFAREDFARVLKRVMPSLRWLERLMRPRLHFMTQPWTARLVGLMCLVLGLALALPLPAGGNWPPAGVIALLALAHLERDGFATLIALGLGGACLILLWTLIAAFAKAVLFFFEWAFA